MKVTQLPRDPGPAGWNCLLEEIPSRASLSGKITADWVIIGAGITGLAAAERLTQLHPKDKIVVLEASRVAHGPAGRNSGFMIDLPHDLASDDYGGGLEADARQTCANRAGIDFAKNIAAQYAMPSEALTQSGKINAAATDKGQAHNRSYAQHLSRMGEPWEMYDAAQMREITGTTYYQSGLFTPGTAMLQPALYLRILAGGLRKSRVKIYENTPVVKMQRARDWEVTTPQGQVTAPKCILAVNGHANSFGFFKRQLIHVFTYASMTRALSETQIATLGGHRSWAATPADPLGTTVRRISGKGGDRIVIRNRATYDPTMEVSNSRLVSVAATHRTSFDNRFPMLKDVEMEFCWGGRLCLSRNNVPAFGEVDDGIFAACCQNGLGLAKGTLHGMLAADLASGVSSELLSQTLKQNPPTRLPPNLIALLAGNVLLKWGEYKAGQEL